MAEGKIELADEAANAESEQLPAESDDLLFEVGGSFAGLGMRSAGKFDEAARSLLLITGQPLVDGGGGCLGKTSGGLDASVLGRIHQKPAMVARTLHFPHPGEVKGGHS